jgi:hypothetical protein
MTANCTQDDVSMLAIIGIIIFFKTRSKNIFLKNQNWIQDFLVPSESVEDRMNVQGGYEKRHM